MIRAADPSLLDLDRLAAPLTPETPCGEWLRYEGTYDRVRDARREDDSGLPQGVWQTDLKRADWAAVESLCATALAERSKDLQLAAWLLEAWIQLDSFAGAVRGLELLRRLCATFWEGLYPALGSEMEARLGPIRWINEKLSRRVRLLRLTEPDMTGVLPYSLADWEQAMRTPGGALADAITLGKFEQSANLTPLPWLERSALDARATVAQVRAFDELIDEKTGALAPGLIRFRTEAESAMQLLDTLLDSARARLPQPQRQTELAITQQMPQSVASSLAPLPPAPAPIPLEAAAPGPSGTGIRTRAQAYQLLDEIAEFLFENDPHSPTPYLIRRAVAWGNMQFDALLPELVRDPAGLSDVLQLLRLGQSDNQDR